MKSRLLTAGAACLLVVSPAAMSSSSTATLTVTATVQGVCKFNSAGPTALAFGTIQGNATTNAVQTTANIPFRCSTGTTSSIAVTASANGTVAQPKMSDGAATPHLLNYSVTLNNAAQVGTGHGAGNDLNMTVTGTILAADIQAAYAGATSTAYSDTLTLTISP